MLEHSQGPPSAVILNRLLDPLFGVGGETELLDGQTLDDCYSREAGRIVIKSTAQPDTQVVLRRLSSVDAAPGMVSPLGSARRASRAAAEYGYPIRRRPAGSASLR